MQLSQLFRYVYCLQELLFVFGAFFNHILGYVYIEFSRFQLKLIGVKDLATCGPFCRINLQQVVNDCLQRFGVVRFYWLVSALKYRLVEAVHVLGAERWFQCGHLIENTAQRPNITLAIVGLILPHFWGCVVRCASLRVEHALFCDLGDIQVAKLRIVGF